MPIEWNNARNFFGNFYATLLPFVCLNVLLQRQHCASGYKLQWINFVLKQNRMLKWSGYINEKGNMDDFEWCCHEGAENHNKIDFTVHIKPYTHINGIVILFPRLTFHIFFPFMLFDQVDSYSRTTLQRHVVYLTVSC